MQYHKYLAECIKLEQRVYRKLAEITIMKPCHTNIISTFENDLLVFLSRLHIFLLNLICTAVNG